MTTIAVLADPPREGLVLPDLPATSPLSAAEATELYAAAFRDVLVAVERSGGDLLVNYRGDDDLPDAGPDADAEAEVRALAASALDDVTDVRFEVQVGSTRSARAGNTLAHLLREEAEVRTAAVVWPTAAFLTRSLVDEAAMKLRSSGTVLGPSTDGRTYYAGFAEPIDYADAFAGPSLESLTTRTVEAGGDVDFLPVLPTIETGSDLLTALPIVRARRAADRIVPRHTAAFLDDVGLRVAGGDGEDGDRRLVRDGGDEAA